MDDLEKYQRIIDDAEQQQREYDRCRGAADQLKQHCRDAYGTDDVEELEAKLAKDQKELAKLERQLEQEAERFDRKHGDKLRDAS